MDPTWKYSRAHRPAAPTIPIAIAGHPVEVVVDTGFSGGILIPFPLFESLGLLSALTPDEYRILLPDSRRLAAFTAKEDVRIGADSIRVDVHASPPIDRKIAGRSFLSQFITTLDGPKEELQLHRSRATGHPAGQHAIQQPGGTSRMAFTSNRARGLRRSR